MSQGQLISGIAAASAVRFVAVEATGLAQETARIHGLGEGAARLAAEGIVATGLMSAHIKGEERITVQVQSELPRASLFGELDGAGNLRARCMPSDLHYRAGGDLVGVLVAIKSDATRELYRGSSEVKGTFEQALATHLEVSAQVDALLRFEVRVAEGAVSWAGGLMVERLPDHPELPNLSSEDFRASMSPLRDQSLSKTFAALERGQLGTTEAHVMGRRELRWRCRCGVDRVRGMLRSLGTAAIEEMIDEDDGAEVSCHFCQVSYRFDAADLRSLLAEG